MGQNTISDKDLLVKYSKKELETIKVESPKEYQYLQYCVKNAFYIANISEEKVKANPKRYKEITLKNNTVTNFYDLKIDVLEKDYQTFIIKGTKQILIIKSKAHILRELNN